MGRNSIHIGTSGWHYRHWKGPFYPDSLPTGDMLKFYSEYLKAVEINNSFYRLPDEKTLKAWTRIVPSDFVFTMKGSRFITHMKKLKDPQTTTPKFLKAAKLLGDGLGPLLFQLPPRWHINTDRLQEFISSLPDEFRYAFEFRDTTWFDDSIYEILSTHQAAFCIYDLAGTLSPKEVTADFVYVRLHGPDGAYQGTYDKKTLAGWAGAFSTWKQQGREIFCFFDNDQAGYAVQNALTLQDMMDS